MIWETRKSHLWFLLFLLLAFILFSACSPPEKTKDKIQIIYSGNIWGYLEPCPT